MGIKPKVLTNFSEIIRKYKNFIFDCDGVIWLHGVLFKEAVNTINTLYKEGKNIFFLSNKNRITKTELYDQLIHSGISLAKYENVYPSSYLTGKYIKDNFPNIKKIYLIGRDKLKIQLEEFHFEVCGGPEDDLKTISLSEVKDFKLDSEIDALVCGTDDKINFYKIVYASNVAMQRKIFFGTNYDSCALYGNVIVPGAYSYISAIEIASNVKAKIVAKPNKDVLPVMMRNFNLSEDVLKETLMIGDSIRTDIQFAVNCGIDSLLVMTGHTKESDLIAVLSNIQGEYNNDPSPTYILNDLDIERIRL